MKLKEMMFKHEVGMRLSKNFQWGGKDDAQPQLVTKNFLEVCSEQIL